MAKQLVKGNEALMKGAILAGCRAFYGYPITPANEIAEAAATYLPAVGGTFLQVESEVGAINMVYGSASAGTRSMTASSGPGISLMGEGISYLAGAELPCVIADITRGGPGLGNIAPEQSDYFQAVKGGGHGCYHALVLAPASAQEMCDLTYEAFDLAEQYRTPVIVLADGFIGQMMEPVEFPSKAKLPPPPSWAVLGNEESRPNLISSIYLEPNELEAHINKLDAKYKAMKRECVRCENYMTEDAELVFVGYGIVSRVIKSAVARLRSEGIRAGLIRPITLFPFPTEQIRALAKTCQVFFTVEMSTGQMIEDVKLAVEGLRPVEFYGRYGGNSPSAEEIVEKAMGVMAHV